jgi:putative two-component system response regulator
LVLELSGVTPIQSRMSRQTSARSHSDRRHSPLALPGAKETRSDGLSDLERAVRSASLVESASDAIVGVSPAGVITSWGQCATRLFGYEREEVVGRCITLLAPPENPQQPHDLISQVLAGRAIERLETERVSRDGERRNVLLSLSAVTDRHGQAVGVLGIYRDISAQRDAEVALLASERRYQSVVEALTEGIVVQDQVGRVLAFNQNAERLLNLPAGTLEESARITTDWSLVHEDGSHVLPDEYPNAVCLRTGQAQRGVILGVRVEDQIGVWLSVSSTPVIDPGESAPTAAVASFTDITAHRQTIEELQTARLEDLERLALVGEYRDDDTFRHTERVGRSAELIAGELGLDGDLEWTIRRAAPLHDVGKIGIPDAILLKPGPLTPQEFEVIKTHTTIGQRILGKSHAAVLRMAAEIAATHHERWDGTGYPTGLRGQEIPIVGRIVGVADTFDAITHARPYKSASSIQDAITEIERCSASQFDANVVDAFKRLDHNELVDGTG